MTTHYAVPSARTRVVRAARALLFAAIVCFLTVTSADAMDAVLEWNGMALAATVTAGQGAVPQVRSLAIVHTSMHDAVNAITCDYKTYLARVEAPAGASPEAAAIAAAHRAIDHTVPRSSRRTEHRARRDAGFCARSPSWTRGSVSAKRRPEQVLQARSTDGASTAQFPYTAPGAGNPGVWVAVGAAPPVLPGWGNVRPWVLRSGLQFRPDGPPVVQQLAVPARLLRGQSPRPVEWFRPNDRRDGRSQSSGTARPRRSGTA